MTQCSQLFLILLWAYNHDVRTWKLFLPPHSIRLSKNWRKPLPSSVLRGVACRWCIANSYAGGVVVQASRVLMHCSCGTHQATHGCRGLFRFWLKEDALAPGAHGVLRELGVRR